MNASVVADTGRQTRQYFLMHWRPNRRDLAAIGIAWLLIVGAMYTATFIVGQAVWGGMGYFFLYAVLACTVCGVGIPLYWTVAVRRRPVADLGITTHRLWPSLGLQLVFSVLLFLAVRGGLVWPTWDALLPLVALALAVGFFEAVFWRGWVLQRLEESFGILPAVLLGSLLYSLYHIGYGMPGSEMLFLFFIGVMFAVAFLFTRNILILWPAFQPLGQLITLVRDGLSLPLIAALGFVEVLALMLLLVWFASRYHKRHSIKPNSR